MVDLILESLNVSYISNFCLASIGLFVLGCIIFTPPEHLTATMDKKMMVVMTLFLSMCFSLVFTLTITNVDLSNVPHQEVKFSHDSGKETLMFDIVYNTQPSKLESTGLAKIQKHEFKVACYKETVKECLKLIESNIQELAKGSNVDDLTASL